MLALGSAAFTGGLKKLLESEHLLKVTFDCRADSDALWHQYGVRLTNVLDVQVYEQAVRLSDGDSFPKRKNHRRSMLPYVKGMSHISERYLPHDTMQHLGGTADNGPHKTDRLVWKNRPLSDNNIAYAANDVHIIRELLNNFRHRKVPAALMLGVDKHSNRYLGHLRDRTTAATFETDKDFIMEEHPIVDEKTWRGIRTDIASMKTRLRRPTKSGFLADAIDVAERHKIDATTSSENAV